MFESPLESGHEPPLAAHLVTRRAFYTHHGIYVGAGRVVHYAGLAHGWRRGPVEDVPLERFARGRGVRVRHDARVFDPREVVARARSRLGERAYRVLTNNCEHLCAWSLRGEALSEQVDAVLSAPRRAARALRAWLDSARPMSPEDPFCRFE